MSDKLKWIVEEREKAFPCGIFDVYFNRSIGPEGQKATFVSLALNDWVVVVPYIPRETGDEFLMVKQFRHGSGTIITEFPAGVVEPGEDPAYAGARELREETGYEPDSLVHLGSINPNPAFLSNTCHFYLATGLHLTGEQNLDLHELIEVVSMPRSRVEDSIGITPDGSTDSVDNGVMLMALAFFWRMERKGK